MTSASSAGTAVNRPSLRGNLALLSISLTVAIFAGEIAARTFYPPTRVGPSSRPYHQISADPDLVYEPLPGASLQVREGGADLLYRINAQGWRGPEAAIPKPAGTFRILVLGDSVVFGDEVNEEESFPRQLEEALRAGSSPTRRYEVVNGGVLGYNTYQEAAWLRARGLPAEPDLVVLETVSNDFENPLWAANYHAYTRSVPLPPGWFPNPDWVVAASQPQQELGWRDRLKEEIRLYNLAAGRWHLLLQTLGLQPRATDGPPDPTPDQYLAALLDYDSVEWRWYRGLVLQMRDLLAARGIPLAVWTAVGPSEARNPGWSQLTSPFERFAAESGIPMVHLWPVLQGRDLGPLYRPRGHFSGAGNRLAAGAVLDLLHSKGLLP